jgi:hypothetical protein
MKASLAKVKLALLNQTLTIFLIQALRRKIEDKEKVAIKALERKGHLITTL